VMRWLIETSLRFRVAVVALSIILVIAGIRSARTTPIDVFPEFAPPMVEIQTEAPGLSTEQVESLVTVPLESALNGISWLETIRSKSVLGLSSIVLIFEEGRDLMRARQLVGERLAMEAGRLTAVAEPPVILPPLSSLSRILKIGMSSPTLSRMELTTLALWTVRPRLMAISGVANVAIWGQRERQLQVIVDPARLAAAGVSLDAVIRAAGDATVLGAGGFVDTPNQRLPVRHVSPIRDPEDLARSLVDVRGGAPIRIGDVAEVREGSPAPIGDAIINDGPGLLLIVEKQPWGNTVDVTLAVEAAVEALRPGLQGIQLDTTIFRPATFIERSMSNLTMAMLLGCLLVVGIIAAFLFEPRTAIISALAIPLSLLAAAVVLHLQGSTMNTMILAGLVIAVGEVVDDAIIDVENIARRLRLNRALENPLPAFRVVLDASLEVRSAVVHASVIVVLVFLPVFFLGGLAGTFFRPLAQAYVLAISASLLVALTITPALCLMLLPGKVRAGSEAPLVRFLKSWYRRALPPLLGRPRLAAGIVLVAFVLSAATTPFLGEGFLPAFRETDFLMHWVEKPGASLEAMSRITTRVSKELRAIPGVRNFGSHIGRAEVADEVVGPNFTELWISIDPDVDYATTHARIEEVVLGYPGLYRDVLTYLKERIKEVLTGASATIVVRIYGPELDGLRAKAAEVRDALVDIPSLTDLKVEAQALVPQLTVRMDPEAAGRAGLTHAAVMRAVTTLIRGTKVGEIYESQKVFDVVVWGSEAARSDLAAVRDLLVSAPGGARVRLGDIARIELEPAPNEIKREGASRRIDVTLNVKGTDLGAAAREVEMRVRGLEFERGYHPEFLGEYSARIESRNRLLGFAALSLAAILLVLHADFGSLRTALLVFATVPFALVGGVAGVWVEGGVISLGSLVGFVTVLGIAARNGIMLVSHYRHLELNEGEPFGSRLILRGAEERLAPILMTALCAALALLPLVIRGQVPGHEIEYPMAVVILGGLLTSTALNLFLLPAIYAAHGRSARVGRDG